MLTLDDFKQLRCNRFPPRQGTKLVIVAEDLENPRNQDTEVEFIGFNVFEDESGQTSFSLDANFGKAGGAKCWDDFNNRGRRWIEENYEPERCWLLIQLDVCGGEYLSRIRASEVRLA